MSIGILCILKISESFLKYFFKIVAIILQVFNKNFTDFEKIHNEIEFLIEEKFDVAHFGYKGTPSIDHFFDTQSRMQHLAVLLNYYL